MTMGNDQSGERDSFRNIETYARLKMDELGLADWQFGWDRAKRRLGVCRLLEKSITISIHFVRASFAKYLKRMALKGRPDTLGQLELAPYEE